MGFVRRLNSAAQPDHFPSAKFQIVPTIPSTQCSASLFSAPNGSINPGAISIYIAGFFITNRLALKYVTVLAPPGDTGTFLTTESSTDLLNTLHTFTQLSNACNFYLHDPPTPQFSKPNCTVTPGSPNIFKSFSFAGYNFTNCKVIVLPPDSEQGTYNILSNTISNIITDHTFAHASAIVSILCYNDYPITTTRSLQDFIDIIRTAGYTYTIKAGNLYTNCPESVLQNLCPLIWNPIQ